MKETALGVPQQQQRGLLQLKVGAIVAYACLLDEAVGATSWRVGAVRAIPVSTQPTPNPSALIGKTMCQALLVQPWVSLAAMPADDSITEGKAGKHKSGNAVEAAANGVSPSSSTPSPRPLPVVTAAVRFAEIDAMQKELEELQRGASGDSCGEVNNHDNGTAYPCEDEDEQLVRTLSQAYTRVLAASNEAAAPTDANPELSRQISEKRNELRKRIEQSLAKMKETRKQQHDLQLAQEDAQKSLQSARHQLREAQEKVQEINTRALWEIQGYRLPPAVVKHVMGAVLCVLGERASSWQEVVMVVRTPSFISRVAQFDPTELSPTRARELKKKYLSDPQFSHEVAMKGSQALVQFQEWVMRQVQHTDADDDLAKFLKQKEAVTAALAASRQQLMADAAELRHLEEELDALMHQQEELLMKGSTPSIDGAEKPSRQPREAAAQQQPRPEKQQESREEHAQQPSATSQGVTSHSRPRQPSAAPAADNLFSESPAPISVRLRAAAAAAASRAYVKELSTSTAAGAAATTSSHMQTWSRPSSTVAQQQKIFALIPPGPQWVCPPPGMVHNTYILRSSVLCVLGYLPRSSGGSRDADLAVGDTTSAPLEDHVFELTNAQHQFVLDAIQQPLNERPPMPLTEEETAAEAARHFTITTHHIKSFDGEEWAMVAEHSPEELRRAIVDDVAAICEVPNRSVTGVEWMLGGLHVQCDVCHPASVSRDALQQALEDSAFPTVMALYESRQQRCAQREAEAEAAAQQQRYLEGLELQQASTKANAPAEQPADEHARQHQQQALRDAEAHVATLTKEYDEQQQMLAASQRELEASQQTLRVTNDVLKKLEEKSRRDAREAQEAAAQADQQLRAAHAALREQGEVHEKEVKRLLEQLAESEKVRQQLQEERMSTQAAGQGGVAAAQPEGVRQRTLVQAQLVEALLTQLRANETASRLCEEERQRQAAATAAAANRRTKRRIALEELCSQLKELSMCMSTSSSPVTADPSTNSSEWNSIQQQQQHQQQQVKKTKEALGCELAVQLHAMKMEKDEAAAAVAQSRRAMVACQCSVDDADTNAKRCYSAKVAEQTRLRALQEAVGSGANAGAALSQASAAGEEGELAVLKADVAAASQRFSSSAQALKAQEEQRLQNCLEEEEDTIRMLQRMAASKNRDASQLMRDVCDLATSTPAQGRRAVWATTWLWGLLFTVVIVLQFRRSAA
ncbi:kinetoplast-associated protein-like protein [Leptomonas seymouri]|uniref:Kinetoplast-associated protein-like protein n=1 Tax=Leptomonas seymouri TaxID=5684 RepID=A0A0N1PD77_LEPSE|nr:kinetoplast-associated protein-like protein [Leptomonas seymouri]|eukprot:KPI88420.1 kinetoplast-associated protein-like protein [Leptomonas seymouri]